MSMTSSQTTIHSSATPAAPPESYTLMHPQEPYDEAMSLVFNAIDDGAMWQVEVMCNGALHSAEYFVTETDALRWAAREATMIAAVHLHAQAERDDAPEDPTKAQMLTPYAPTASAMVSAVNLVRDLSRMVTPRDPDQVVEYCKEYGKDPADMTEDDLEEMESDLENDRVWSDALASYQMIRSAREIVKALTMAARENNASVVDTQSPVADVAAPAA